MKENYTTGTNFENMQDSTTHCLYVDIYSTFVLAKKK